MSLTYSESLHYLNFAFPRTTTEGDVNAMQLGELTARCYGKKSDDVKITMMTSMSSMRRCQCRDWIWPVSYGRHSDDCI